MIGGTVLSAALLVVAVTFVMLASNGSGAQASAPRSAPKLPPRPVAVSEATTEPLSPHGAPIVAYKGLATWVDVYDQRAWRNPSAAIHDMARHGVKTLFVQTAHYNSRQALFSADALRKFISEGHSHGIRVVAWYLPNMKPGSVDYRRIQAAVELRTEDGQAFDSFALDIESSAIPSDEARNSGLAALTAKMRKLVGPTYPLGAIIPAPVGLQKPNSVWHNFPYTALAQTYDVFVPMGYYTIHGRTAKAAYADATANLRLLRSHADCATMPVHLIGGISEDSSLGQVQAFAKAVRAGGCLGASLYGWPGTSPAAWKTMGSIYR